MDDSLLGFSCWPLPTPFGHAGDGSGLATRDSLTLKQAWGVETRNRTSRIPWTIRDRGQHVPLRTKRDSPQSPSSCLRWKVWPKDMVSCSLRGWEQQSHRPFLLTSSAISGHLCEPRAPWASSSTRLHARTVEPTGSWVNPAAPLYSWWQVPRAQVLHGLYGQTWSTWGESQGNVEMGVAVSQNAWRVRKTECALGRCGCLPAFLPPLLLASRFLPFPSIHRHLLRLSCASYCIYWWRCYGFSSPLKAFKLFPTHKDSVVV